MIKKALSIVAIAALLTTTSCKKETETKVETVLTDTITKTNTEVDTTVSTEEEVPTTPANPNAKFASMDFDKTVHDFGKIVQGDKVETTFTFTNTGEADLVIVSAKGSCGCTVPEYPKTPVKPGQKAKMKVSFNSAGKKGHNKKTISIVANTKKGRETLTITADVALNPTKKLVPNVPSRQMAEPVTNKQALK